MPRIKQASLDALTRELDSEYVLSLLGATHIQHAGPELRAFCPVHGSDHQRSLAVRLEDNVAMCHNTSCPAHKGGSLLWLHSIVHGYSIREAAEFWARKLGFKLEYEPPYPLPEEFIYMELAGNSMHGNFWRNRLVALDNISSSGGKADAESYTSIFRYNIPNMPQLRKALREGKAFLYGGFYADLDNPFPDESRVPAGCLKKTPFSGIATFEEGMEWAKADAVQIVESLIIYGIPEEAIRSFFSGRGFHIQVDPRVFGVRPSTDLHLVYQQLAFMLAGVDESKAKVPLLFSEAEKPSKMAYPARLQTMDQNIYNSDRLWRLPNSVNLKSGKYKIPLSIDELSNLDAFEILDLASKGRPLTKRGTVEINEKARQLFIRAWQKARKKQDRLSSPESQFASRGYEIVYLSQNGKPVKGRLPKDIAGAAAQLARQSNCPVVLAVKKERPVGALIEHMESSQDGLS